MPPNPELQRQSATLASALTALGVTLARVEAGAQLDAEARLQRLWQQLQALLGRHDPLGGGTLVQQLARVKALVREFDPQIVDTFSALADRHDATREQVAVWQAGALVSAVQAAFPMVRALRQVGERTLARLARHGLVLGATTRDWWGRLAATVGQRVADTVRQAVMQERTPVQLRQAMTDVQTQTERSVNRVIQTSLGSVSQQAQAAVRQANPRTVQAVAWQTTLDDRACIRCIALSGLRWTADHEPLGHSLPWPGEPPLHIACRCALVPLPDDETTIPDQSFDAWLRDQPAGEQRAILGPGRWQLWQAGRLRLRNLVDQRHRALTLDELRRESAA